jgi:hypothetical protein
MEVTQSRIRPPRGDTVASSYVWGAGMLTPIVLLAYVPMTSVWVQRFGAPDGHLSSPLLQWIFASLPGLLLRLALGALVYAVPLTLFAGQVVVGRWLALALDMTDVPDTSDATWRPRLAALSAQTRRDRWLGSDRRARRTSWLLLGGAALILVALAAVFVAVSHYALSSAAPCPDGRCPPEYFAGMVQAFSSLLGMPLVWLAIAWRVRRVQDACGIWLRFDHRSVWRRKSYYVRWPGTTPEAATAALARFRAPDGAPLARLPVGFFLALVPYILLVAAGILLDVWLRLQWAPG